MRKTSNNLGIIAISNCAISCLVFVYLGFVVSSYLKFWTNGHTEYWKITTSKVLILISCLMLFISMVALVYNILKEFERRRDERMKEITGFTKRNEEILS